MTRRPEIRPAEAADIALFYPDGAPTMRAIVVEIDGRVIGLAGLVFQGPLVTAVSIVLPELRSQSPPLPLALQAGRRWGGRLCQFRRWLRGCRGRLCRRLSQGPTA